MSLDDSPIQNSEGQVVNDFRLQIEEAKKDHANSYLRIGAILSLAKEEKVWKAAGAESFAHWVREFGFSKAFAYSAISIHERFRERASGILPSRLQALLPVKTESREEEDNLLIQAREYTAEAFHNVIVERKG